MEIDVFLIRHGARLMPALVLAACAAALGAAALVRAWRIRGAMKRFAARAGDAPRDIRRASAGVRVVTHGRIAVRGPAIEAFPVASARFPDAELTQRVPSVEVHVDADRRIRLIGEITIETAVDERRVKRVPHETFLHLHRAGLDVREDDPVTLRRIRATETVIVLGRAVGVAGGSDVTYRDAALTLGIGPDDDGRVHLVAFGTGRDRARSIARLTAPLAAVAVAATLLLAPIASMHAPRSSWSIPQPSAELPLAYWLPLATPFRTDALDASSEWLTRRLARAPFDPHLGALAIALREAGVEDCPREVALVGALGSHTRDRVTDRCDAAVAASSTAALTTAIPPGRQRDAYRALAIAIDRDLALRPALLEHPNADGLTCPPCEPRWPGVLLDVWSVGEVLVSLELRSDHVRRYRGEWLRGLAASEAAFGRRQSAAALLIASERDLADERDARATRRAVAMLGETAMDGEQTDTTAGSVRARDPDGIPTAFWNAIRRLNAHGVYGGATSTAAGVAWLARHRARYGESSSRERLLARLAPRP